MTNRKDEFAALAMVALVAREGAGDVDAVAEKAWALAEAMIDNEPETWVREDSDLGSVLWPTEATSCDNLPRRDG